MGQGRGAAQGLGPGPGRRGGSPGLAGAHWAGPGHWQPRSGRLNISCVCMHCMRMRGRDVRRRRTRVRARGSARAGVLVR